MVAVLVAVTAADPPRLAPATGRSSSGRAKGVNRAPIVAWRPSPCFFLRHSRRLTVRHRCSAIPFLLRGVSAALQLGDHARVDGEVRARAARMGTREMDEQVFGRMLREGKITAEDV